MSSTPKRRLIQALGAGGLGQLINVVMQVASVPLFLRFWGAERYGEWIMLSTVPAYLVMSDIGFVSAAGNEMAMRAGRGDRDGAVSVFQSISWLVLIVFTALGLLLTPVVWLCPVERWLGVTGFTHAEVGCSVMLFLLQVAIGLMNGVVFFAFRCDGKYPLGAVVADVSRLIEFAILIAAMVSSRSPVVLGTAMVVARAGTSVWMRRVLRRVSPWIYFGVDRVSRREVRQLATPAVAFMGFPVGNALAIQGMVMVVGRLMGPVAVVGFTTVRTLCNMVQQLLGLLNGAIGPEMSLAFGAGNLELARRLHRLACQAAVWIGVSMALGLAIFGLPILRIWTGRKIEVNTTLLYLMLVVMVSRCFWYTSSVVGMATNRHKGISAWFCIGSVLAIVTAGVAIYLVGLPGAAIGLLVTELIMNLVVVRHSIRLLEDDYRSFGRALTRPPMLGQFLRRRAAASTSAAAAVR
jgi:O-antigen/teichoic acid export membrane protein